MLGSRKFSRVSAAYVTLCLLAGCSSTASNNSSDTTNDSQESQINDLKQRVATLEFQNSKEVILKLSDTGYTPLQTDIGTLTVQLKSLDANGSGTKVHLLIGNPTTASINELEIEGAWGAMGKDGTPQLQSEHDFSTRISDGAPPASWKNIYFNIDGGTPTEIGYIRIKSASIQRINLYRNS